MQSADNAPSIDRWFAGEPHARKRARGVRRGAVGKAFSFGKQLAGRLPYVRRVTTQIDTFRRKEVLERNIALRASGLP